MSYLLNSDALTEELSWLSVGYTDQQIINTIAMEVSGAADCVARFIICSYPLDRKAVGTIEVC